MNDPEVFGDVLGETLERVRQRYASAPTTAEATERQQRRAHLERIEAMRRAARDPSLGLPQGPAMLRKALAPASGKVGLWLDRVYAFARGERRRACTVLVGSNPGTGKSTAAVRIILRHVASGSSGLYIRSPLLPSVRNYASAALYDRVRDVDLLVVDELGMEADAATVVALLLERHDNERVTVFLGNLGYDEMLARYRLTLDARVNSRLRGVAKLGLRPVVAFEDRDFRADGE